MADLTQNINFLQPTSFKLVIDRKNLPNLTYFVNTIMHPSVALNPADIGYQRTNVRFVGDKLNYGEMQCQVIMDEDMTAYTEMFNWMKSIVENPVVPSTERMRAAGSFTTVDLSIVLLSSVNTANKTIKYINAIPVSLGDINFETTTADSFITFPITFAFDYWEIV